MRFETSKLRVAKSKRCIFGNYADYTLIENYMFSEPNKLHSQPALQVTEKASTESLASLFVVGSPSQY